MSDIRCFSAKIARFCGDSDSATFINHLQYRIGENRSHDKHFYDGRYWTYNSTKYLTENLYPYLSLDQMDRIIKKLIDKGIIIVGNYNKNKYDKTRWFAFVDEEKFIEPKIGREDKNSESHPEPKNQNSSPQTVAAVHSAKTRHVEPQGFQTATCLKTVGMNQVMKQDIDEYQSVKPHIVVHKDFQGNSSPQTVAAVHSAISRNRYRENAEPIPLISFNKKEREDIFCKNASPSLKGSEIVLKEKKGRGSRLSPTWELPEEYREWALQRGLFNEQIDFQADKFKDHWISTTKGSTKLDWFATWRNWLRSAKDIRLMEKISQVRAGTQNTIPVQQPPNRTSDDPKIQQWYDMKGEGLELKYGPGIWKGWLEPLELVKFSKDEAIFKAPTKFFEYQIKTYYLSGIYQCLKRIDPEFGVSSLSCRYPENNSIQIVCDE